MNSIRHKHTLSLGHSRETAGAIRAKVQSAGEGSRAGRAGSAAAATSSVREHPKRPIRVVGVDDNPMVAEAFGVWLGSLPGFQWLGHRTTTAELERFVKEQGPDVVLLDVDMPGEDTFTALARIAEEVPSTRVLMVSGHVSAELVERAIEGGAWGYVSKNDTSEVLRLAIEAVASGRFAFGEVVCRVFQK